MDGNPAVTGLLSILSALFGVLTVLFSYTWSLLYSLLYLLASPLLYLGRGLLSIARFPLQILLKFKVSAYPVLEILEFVFDIFIHHTHQTIGIPDILDWRSRHWSHSRFMFIPRWRLFITTPQTSTIKSKTSTS